MRFTALTHNEVSCGLQRPRHPVVCILDLFGLVLTLGLLIVYPHKPSVTLLPWAVIALYSVSCLHHWLPYNKVRQKVDHLLIAVVIFVTYLPFWTNKLASGESLLRTTIMGLMFLGVSATKTWFIDWHRAGGLMFLAMALYGTGASFLDLQEWLSGIGLAFWWVGLGLYLAQMVVYSVHRPDPLPEQLGYREVQHALLLPATTLHCLTVLQYL